MLAFSSTFLQGQPTVEKAMETDRLFWSHYNACSIEDMMPLISEDVEFYHDKNGILKGSHNFKASFEKNLCTNSDRRLRRAAIDSTVQFFPMKNGDLLYGVLITGEHLFYVTETGKPEWLDGLAKFADLWIWDWEHDQWNMSRILSYDHGPAPYVNPRTAIGLPNSLLKTYEGIYKSVVNGPIRITATNDHLILSVGTNDYNLLAETKNRFFIKERDLTFEFITDNGRKMIVRENGTVTETDEIMK